jgi:fucose 4-O-acetylase-like acetyltransferase
VGNRGGKVQRQQWIDMLRGINISLVVVSHVTSAPGPMRFFFVFAMPLFFMIAGWLHRDTSSQSECLRKSIAGLLVPYLSYLVILWPLELLAAYPDQVWDAEFLLLYMFKPMVLGGPLLKGFCAAFWFITCLFFTKQLVHYMVRHYPPRICWLFFGGLLACAYLHAWLLPQRWFPWNIHTVLFVAPFYYLGYRVRKVNFDFLNPRIGVLCFLVAAAGVSLNVAGFHNRLDLKYLDYGLPLVTVASAVAWCGLLAMLAKLFAASHAGNLFAEFGTASITIMFTHQIIQLVMAKQFGLENGPLRIAAALLFGLLLHRFLVRQPLLGRLFIGPRAASQADPVVAMAARSP